GAERLAQEDVLAAGARHRGAQLAVGERAEERERAGAEPEREIDPGRGHVAGHDRGADEDPRADHRAYDQCGRREDAEPPLQRIRHASSSYDARAKATIVLDKPAMIEQLLRRKSVDDAQSDAEAPEGRLKRTLGPYDLTALGIGAIIGAG